jgi:hypothetical protein
MMALLTNDLRLLFQLRGAQGPKSSFWLSLNTLATLCSGAAQGLVYLVEREVISAVKSDPLDGCTSPFVKVRNWFYLPLAFFGFASIYGVAETWLLASKISVTAQKRVQRYLYISKSLSSAFVGLVPIIFGVDMLVVCAIAPLIASVAISCHCGRIIITDLDNAKTMQYTNEGIFDKPIAQIKRNCLGMVGIVLFVVIMMIAYTFSPRHEKESSFARQGFTTRGVLSLMVVQTIFLVPMTSYSYCRYVNKNVIERIKKKAKKTIKTGGSNDQYSDAPSANTSFVSVPNPARVAPT